MHPRHRTAPSFPVTTFRASMIDRHEMFDVLLAACPSFSPAWEEFLAEWQHEKEDPPLYLALGDLCRHVIAMLDDGDEETVRHVFAVVERWHTDGDEYVRTAASIGFLESLSNALGDGAAGRAREAALRAIAGPETRSLWTRVDRFWNGDASALSNDPDPRPRRRLP